MVGGRLVPLRCNVQANEAAEPHVLSCPLLCELEGWIIHIFLFSSKAWVGPDDTWKLTSEGCLEGWFVSYDESCGDDHRPVVYCAKLGLHSSKFIPI